MPKPTLNDLSVFQDVAALRSFRKAADARGIKPSTLSHTVRSLEKTLGVRLLNRTTRSVSLTEAGAAFLKRIAPTLQDLDAAIDELAAFQGTPSGTVRINVPEVAARLLLTDVLPTLRKAYPQISVDIAAEGRLVDIVAEGFDAGVRLGEAVPQDMIAVRLGGPVVFVAVASPDYLDAKGTPEIPDDLMKHECIRHRLPSGKPYRWEFARKGQEVAIDVPGHLTLDSLSMMAQAAADGLGVAFIPDIAATDLLESGRLVPILSDWCPPMPGLFIYYPGRRQVPNALRALIDIIRKTYR